MSTTLTPHIEATPGICGGKPCVAGTRIRVQDIYVWHELERRTPEEVIQAFPQLTLADIHAALAYYWDHRDEIHADMERAVQLVAEMKSKLGPGPLARKLADMNRSRDPLSP